MRMALFFFLGIVCAGFVLYGMQRMLAGDSVGAVVILLAILTVISADGQMPNTKR